MKCIRHLAKITLAGGCNLKKTTASHDSGIYHIHFRNRYDIVIHQLPVISSCAKYMIKRSYHGLFHIRSLISPWFWYETGISGPRADEDSDMKKDHVILYNHTNKLSHDICFLFTFIKYTKKVFFCLFTCYNIFTLSINITTILFSSYF